MGRSLGSRSAGLIEPLAERGPTPPLPAHRRGAAGAGRDRARNARTVRRRCGPAGPVVGDGAVTHDRRGLLRWYPRGWRDGTKTKCWRCSTNNSARNVAAAAAVVVVRARVNRARPRRQAVQLGRTGAKRRWRDGSLLVLVAWATFMVGGAAFAKATEHFDQAVPAGSRMVPEVGFQRGGGRRDPRRLPGARRGRRWPCPRVSATSELVVVTS